MRVTGSMDLNDDVLVRSFEVSTRRAGEDVGAVGDQALLLETMLGRYVLNADANEVWSLVDGRRQVREISELVGSRRGLSASEVTPSVRYCCLQLLELRLVEVRTRSQGDQTTTCGPGLS